MPDDDEDNNENLGIDDLNGGEANMADTAEISEANSLNA